MNERRVTFYGLTVARLMTKSFYLKPRWLEDVFYKAIRWVWDKSPDSWLAK